MDWAPAFAGVTRPLTRPPYKNLTFAGGGSGAHHALAFHFFHNPGRLRFEYKNPLHNFVVADGLFIHFWDAKMKEVSDAPIGQTLADFILKDKVAFDDTVQVTHVRRHDGMLEVTLVQAADPGSGELTLVFENQPLELHAWRVKDATGRTSKVSLMNETEGHFDPELFIFKQPN